MFNDESYQLRELKDEIQGLIECVSLFQAKNLQSSIIYLTNITLIPFRIDSKYNGRIYLVILISEDYPLAIFSLQNYLILSMTIMKDHATTILTPILPDASLCHIQHPFFKASANIQLKIIKIPRKTISRESTSNVKNAVWQFQCSLISSFISTWKLSPIYR